jgi:hypothetical protein
VAPYEDICGQLIIRREGTCIAPLVLDFPPVSFCAAAAQLAGAETERWCATKPGLRQGLSSRPSTLASFPPIFASFLLITDPIERAAGHYLGRQSGLKKKACP